MFEVGFTEIVLILGLALLVLGPEKLPGLAEKVGRWTGRARAMARQLRTQLEQEVTLEEIAKSRPMQAPRHEPAATPDAAPTTEPEPAAIHDEPVQQNFNLHSQPTIDTAVTEADPSAAATAAADKVETKVTQ
jgi:Tat protein translocase TatB subunit